MERFYLRLPAVVSLKDRKETPLAFSRELKTWNVCAGGAFIMTDTPLPLGTEVDINLHLTFFTGNPDYERGSNIHISGSVIRIEPTGMAVKFGEDYLILPAF